MEGLLITPEQQAVLDAAEAYADASPYIIGVDYLGKVDALRRAVREMRSARQEAQSDG